MYIEYKHWKVNNASDIIDKIKTVRNTKGLFSLANNIPGGVYVIGVDDESCQAKGLEMLSQADQAEFRARLTSWMTADDAGHPRIWGSEGHVPCEGADNDWEVAFIPVINCPGGKVHHLIVIHMHHCPGGMFEGAPECYQVNDAGNIIALPFEQWKQRILEKLNTNSIDTFSIQSKSSPMTLPSPPVSLPSPPVSLPSPPVSLPSPAVSLPSPAVTLPSPAVSLPSPAVSLPSPAVTLPSPAVSLSSPTVSLSSPAVSLPSPAVSLPSPAVSLPSPAVSLSSPTVSLSSPAVSLSSPAVSLSSPAVSLPSPAVSFPSPAVSLPSPAVTLPSPVVTLPSPAVTLPAPDLSEGSATALAEVNQNYHSASWTKCGEWNAFLTKEVMDEHSFRGSQMSEFQLSSPLALVPNKEQLTLDHPPDQVKAIVDALNNQYSDIPGLALTFPCLAEIFDHTLNIIPPIDHVLDTLILLKDLSLEVWSSYRNALSHSNREQRKAYGFEVCRIIKRYTLETQQQSTQHNAINLSINPYIFTTTTRTLDSFRKSGDSLHEHYMSCLGHTEGMLLEHVLSQLANNTVSKVVWIKNRINKDITYHLTQQQCQAFLKCCNGRILLIEAAPGCGKSVMAAYICQRFGKHNKPKNVLYIGPRKGFAAIVKNQGNAKTCVAYDESTLQKAISVIHKANYKVIVMDDIQAMSCSQSIWDRLLDTVYGKKARLLLLMDSEYQDFHNSGSCEALRTSIDEFCKKKHIPRTSSHTLTTNLRNSQKVFSFLVAQIESHPDASSQGEFTCGHDIEGDDVHIRVIYNPWKDSADNDLIQLVAKLTTQPGEHRYELRDIVLLIDDTDPQAATKLRQIFSTHSAMSTCQAFDVPHQGLVVDSVDEFIGMEAQVCIVIFPSNNRSHNIKYRIFMASRGIMRTELVFVDDISADLVKTMALSNLAEAEVNTRPRRPVKKLWTKTTSVLVREVTTRSLPATWTSIDNPRRIGISPDGGRGVVSTHESEDTTLILESGVWRQNTTYRLMSTDRYISAITITNSGEVIIQGAGSDIIKYSVKGDVMWRESPGGFIAGVAVSHQGQIYAADYRNNRLLIYTPDGTRTSSITITRPLAVCVSSSGRRLLVLHEEDRQYRSQLVVSVLNPDGHVRRRLCDVPDARVDPCRRSLSLLGDRYMAVCADGDIHLYDISDHLV